MKKISNSRGAAAFAVASCLTLCAGVAAAAPEAEDAASWKTVAASGPVHSRPNLAPEDEWFRVRRGMEYLPLTYLRTGRKGNATLTQDAHILIVRSNSMLRLPDMQSGDPDSQVFQDSGRVTYEVDGSQFDRFEVVTPYLIAGVKGTVFTVTVNRGSASIQVLEGVVEVSSRFNEEMVELREGEEVFFDSEKRDHLQVRESEPVLVEKTRKAVWLARNRVADAVPFEPGATGNENDDRSLADGADPMDEPAGAAEQGDPGLKNLLDEEVDTKDSLSMDEVDRISREEMKDLDSNKARKSDPANAADNQQ